LGSQQNLLGTTIKDNDKQDMNETVKSNRSAQPVTTDSGAFELKASKQAGFERLRG